MGGGSSQKANAPPFEVHVLVVDDDATSLKIILRILTSMNYKAVGMRHPLLALEELHKTEDNFHLLVTDVHMPDIDGFQLKQRIDEEFALPIIMISVDKNETLMEKALMGGVMRYILKPATTNDFKGIWQYAITGRKALSKQNDNALRAQMTPWEDNGSAPKKTKVVWTNRLQSRFLEAINVIGLEKAVPKKILQIMNVPGLTRENVASHLQKYRLFLKRVAQVIAMLMNEVNDRDILLSSLTSRYPSLMMKNIREEFDRISKQSQLIQTVNLPSNSTTSISQVGYDKSKLWSFLAKSQHSFNPSRQVGHPTFKTNEVAVFDNSTQANTPYPYGNAANQVMTKLLQVYQEPCLTQQTMLDLSGSVNYNFSKPGSSQTPSSNYTNYNAGMGLFAFDGRVEMGQIDPNGNGVSNPFDYGYDLLNETNMNNVTATELLTGEVVFPTSEARGATKNQSLLVSMGANNNMEDTEAEPLNEPPQQQHQLSNEECYQNSAIGDTYDSSNITSHESHLNGTDFGETLMDGIYNLFFDQQESMEELFKEVNNPMEFTMEITTTNGETSKQQNKEGTGQSVEADNMHPSDDNFPPFHQISNQLHDTLDVMDWEFEHANEFEQFHNQDWEEDFIESLFENVA